MVQPFKTKQLQQVIEIITKVSRVERIYLLGVSHFSSVNDNIFLRHPPQNVQVKEYQFLVVIPDVDRSEEDNIQNTIENSAKKITAVTTIVAPVKVFNYWLEHGHLLAHKVYHSDCLVYESGNNVIAAPGKYEMADLENKVRKEFLDWNERADDFFYGVEGLRSMNKTRAASFMLHQVAELTLMSVIRLVTGYRAGTHNLERMMRYAVPFCGDAINVFPRNSDAERKLFKKLQKAYIHARYKEDFEISDAELAIIIERLKLLVVTVNEMRDLPIVR